MAERQRRGGTVDEVLAFQKPCGRTQGAERRESKTGVPLISVGGLQNGGFGVLPVSSLISRSWTLSKTLILKCGLSITFVWLSCVGCWGIRVLRLNTNHLFLVIHSICNQRPSIINIYDDM